MKFKLVAQYSAKTIHGHLATPSGKYMKPDGTELEYDDLHQVKDMYQQVLAGTYEFTGLKQNLKRELNYTNDGSDPDAKQPLALEYRNNFDHIIIEGIPASADAEAIRDAITDSLNSVISYEAQKRDKGKVSVTHQMPAGEKQIFTRIETAESGNQHIHILMNKRGFLTKEIIEKELENNKDNPLVVSKLNETLDKMKIAGVDKALGQALNLQATYDQKLMGELINKTLISRGLSPIESFGSFTASADSNKKTTSEAKQAVNEIFNNDFDETTVNKVVEEIQTQEYSSVDSVIIQKRIAENKARAEQLATELQKVVSESKQLEQAQKAVNENSLLQNEVKKLKSVVEEANKKVNDKDEYIEILKNNHQDEIDEINRDNRVKITRKDEEILEKNEKLKALEEEFDTTWKDKEAVEAQFKEYVEKTDKELEQIPQLQDLLNTANTQNKQYQEMFALQQEQIKQNQELLKQTQEQFKEAQEQLKLSNEENIKLTKQRIEIEEIKEKAFADLKKLSEEFAQKQEENKELAKANQELKNANNVLSNTLTQFAELSNKLKTNYTKFIGAMRDKLKTNPALKKEISNINRDFANLEKQNQTIEKEVKTVVEAVKTDKALTDSQRSLLNMFGTQEQKKPDEQTNNRTTPTGRKPT